ncbi:S-layer homology domain-containing protein [Paenibacillus pabuli]|nr:S-layer homology domain-containing protein [Paenibacillus pabuli]
MKKILSVALSTAMAFSMFASVAFGDTAVSPQQQFDALKAKGVFTGYPDGTAGLDKEMTRAEFAKVITKLLGLKEITGVYSYNDKNYNAKNWAAPYIEAVTAAGIMEGKNVEKKIFDFNGKVTIEEMAKVLTIALDLEVPTETNNTATAWAKGYVQAAINAGLLDTSLNFQSNASRQLLVGAAYAIDQAQSLKVASYEVSEAGKVVTFKISDGESVKVTLDKALEANKETEVKFTYKDKEFTEKVTYVVTTATKVESVTATNLKEVVVTYDGKVDKETAEEASNYALKSGKAIDKVVLSADEKTATITLVGTLTNNKADFLTVSNVKAGDKVVSAKEVSFTTSDNELPKVESVKSLGTKSVKVVFSEPVQLPEQKSFELDGKTFFGKVTQPTSRTVILTPYNTAALSVGDHKLTIASVKDFANFVSLTSTHDITVAEDTTAPTITEASATLETVTVTFSEEVDPETIKASNVYWTSGNSNKESASFKAIEDNQYKFTFNRTNSLPTGNIAIHVEGVKDYSGNQIAKGTTVNVTPEVDMTRPEVKKVESTGKREIQVKFSKVLLDSTVTDAKNYTVTDKDNKVIPVKQATRIGDLDTVKIELYSDLSAGDNNITIKNIKDNTRLENTMLDYTGKINVADTAAPKIDSQLVNASNRTVVIGFDKKLDAATLADYSNYHVDINNERLPLTAEMAEINVLQDANAVAITFVETYKNQVVRFASASGGSTSKNVQNLYVLGVKDAAGNLLKDFTTTPATNKVDLSANLQVGLGTYDTDYAGYSAALTSKNTVEVKFNAGIVSAPRAAFTVNGTNVGIKDVEVTGTSTVKLVLNSDLASTSASNLTVSVDRGQLTTLVGTTPTAGTQTTSVLDKVAPQLKENATGYSNFAVAGQDIKVDFTEDIQLDAGVTVATLARDFKVVRYIDGKTLTPVTDYTVAVGADSVTITLKDQASRSTDSLYTISFEGSKYLTDKSVVKNQVASFSDKETNTRVGYQAATAVTITGPATLAVQGSPVTQQYNSTAKDAAGNTVPGTVAWTIKNDPVTGVSINNAGLLTVAPNAAAGNIVLVATHTAGTTVTSKEYTVQLTKAAAQLDSITASATTTPATLVAGTPGTASLTAVTKDQYGDAFTATVTWSSTGTLPAGITLDPATGQVTVDATVAAGTYSFVAKSGSVTSNTVNVVVTP